jgi:hypothetical protein
MFNFILAHIVKPQDLGYQQPKLLPKLENLANGLALPMIVAFHKEKQLHPRVQKSPRRR